MPLKLSIISPTEGGAILTHDSYFRLRKKEQMLKRQQRRKKKNVDSDSDSDSDASLSSEDEEFRIKLTDDDANQYPYLYMTGHGNIRFTDDEVIALRSILMNGGFLHADDNYGMNDSFRREMKRVFPNKDLVTLPHDHPLFSSYFKMPNGLPKVHEHDNHPPQALALFEDKRIILVYTFESDLGDGWEDASVHQDPFPIREAALKMGVNIIYFALTQ